jgi:hypothetical protein
VELESSTEPRLIELAVQPILESSVFRSSKQCQTLFRYIVDQSLAGHDALLRERVIGTAVFGRAPDYDCGNDPIVRARVNEVRKRLAQYYQNDQNHGPVRISIPSGSYRAVFNVNNDQAGTKPRLSHDEREGHLTEAPRPTSVSLVDTLPEDSLRTIRSADREVLPDTRKQRLPILDAWRMTAAVICTLLVAASIVAAEWRKSELDLFWKPVLDSKNTAFLYTGTVGPLYQRVESPSVTSISPSDQQLPALPILPRHVDTSASAESTFLPIEGDLAPSADIAADLKIAALMTDHGRKLSLRSGEALQFADLRGSPVVLIGAYDNYWTLDLARNLPFYLDRGVRIRERKGQRRSWSSVSGRDNAIVEDYAIVFRLLDSETGGPVIAVAGLTTCGTQASAEFATDPVQMKKLASVPRDVLAAGNLELVLHTTLVNCTPASTEIVAQTYW